eukprot:SAG31_NODE_8834_length_1377_cov_7.518293_2_plen_106_part_00
MGAAGLDPRSLGLPGPNAVAEYWLPVVAHRGAVDILLGRLGPLLDQLKALDDEEGAAFADDPAANARPEKRHAADVVQQLQEAEEAEHLESLRAWLQDFRGSLLD